MSLVGLVGLRPASSPSERPFMQHPSFGLIIVGDEILSGKRQDAHFTKVREMLQQVGLSLAWVHYAGDDREALSRARS